MIFHALLMNIRRLLVVLRLEHTGLHMCRWGEVEEEDP